MTLTFMHDLDMVNVHYHTKFGDPTSNRNWLQYCWRKYVTISIPKGYMSSQEVKEKIPYGRSIYLYIFPLVSCLVMYPLYSPRPTPLDETPPGYIHHRQPLPARACRLVKICHLLQRLLQLLHCTSVPGLSLIYHLERVEQIIRMEVFSCG